MTDEFRARLRQQIVDAYGLDAAAAEEVFSTAPGSYGAAAIERDAAEARFKASLTARCEAAARKATEMLRAGFPGLPEGVRFAVDPGPNPESAHSRSRLPLLVIAGDYRQYLYFCGEHRLDPRTDARYVRSVQDVRGLGGGVRYACYGTWNGRRELADVFAHLESCGAAEVFNEPQRTRGVPRTQGPGERMNGDAFSMSFAESSGDEPV